MSQSVNWFHKFINSHRRIREPQCPPARNDMLLMWNPWNVSVFSYKSCFWWETLLWNRKMVDIDFVMIGDHSSPILLHAERNPTYIVTRGSPYRPTYLRLYKSLKKEYKSPLFTENRAKMDSGRAENQPALPESIFDRFSLHYSA